MPIHSFAAAAIIAASTIAASSAHAQFIDDSFTYQGSLMDNGVPANGLYDIQFFVYDSEVGGNIVPGGFLPLFDVEVVDGLFSVEVDFGTSGSVFDSFEHRYLELHVSEAGQPGATILAPRQKFVPAPLANFALRAGHALFADTTLYNAYQNGNTIFFDDTVGSVNLQGFGNALPILNFNNALAEARMTLGIDFFEDSGYLTLIGSMGSPSIRLEQDFSNGGGGFIQVARNDIGHSGIVLEGNSLGSNNAFVGIYGSDRSIVFNTDEANDDSVSFPNNAVNASEILDEPGVAESINAGSVALTQTNTTIDTLSSITISAPADGFVLLIASAELSVLHISNVPTSVNLGLSTTTTAFPVNLDHETYISGSNTGGTFDFTVTTHAVFPASMGSNTYYFLGDLNNVAPTSATVLDQQVTAVFIPSAYGIAGLQSTTTNLPDEYNQISPPMTQLDILAEQNAALQASHERQQRELDEMRAQFEQLKRELDQNQ